MNCLEHYQLCDRHRSVKFLLADWSRFIDIIEGGSDGWTRQLLSWLWSIITRSPALYVRLLFVVEAERDTQLRSIES